MQTCSGTHHVYYSVGTGGLSGVKWQGRDVDHSGPSSSEVKNKWVYNSASPICLHDMYGGKFSLKIKAQIIYFNKFICVSLPFISVRVL